jgi:hypothetical protein
VAKSGGKVGFAKAGGRYRSEVPGTEISGKIKKFIMKVTIQLGTESFSDPGRTGVCFSMCVTAAVVGHSLNTVLNLVISSNLSGCDISKDNLVERIYLPCISEYCSSCIL